MLVGVWEQKYLGRFLGVVSDSQEEILLRCQPDRVETMSSLFDAP